MNATQATISDSEIKARALAASRPELLKRLRQAAKTLTARRDVSKWEFDFTEQTLTSPDGDTCVKWFVRHHPELPESYDNQQTTVGSCRLISVG